MFYLQKKTLVHEVDLKKGFMTPIVVWLYLKYLQRKKVKESGLILALDSVRDPGNLGTILRLCDWFGFEQLLCSKETVDIYNPKVVQATMGSIARVNVYGYKLLCFKYQITGFGTFMDGLNIYKAILPREGIIIMGNEANGIEDLEKLIKIDSQFVFGDIQNRKFKCSYCNRNCIE
jgi:TrmH family RNA methyltransferase